MAMIQGSRFNTFIFLMAAMMQWFSVVGQNTADACEQGGTAAEKSIGSSLFQRTMEAAIGDDFEEEKMGGKEHLSKQENAKVGLETWQGNGNGDEHASDKDSEAFLLQETDEAELSTLEKERKEAEEEEEKTFAAVEDTVDDDENAAFPEETQESTGDGDQAASEEMLDEALLEVEEKKFGVVEEALAEKVVVHKPTQAEEGLSYYLTCMNSKTNKCQETCSKYRNYRSILASCMKKCIQPWYYKCSTATYNDVCRRPCLHKKFQGLANMRCVGQCGADVRKAIDVHRRNEYMDRMRRHHERLRSRNRR